MTSEETEAAVSVLIARWENLTRLLYSWTAPEASAVEWADSEIIPLERELDERVPGWHEEWTDRPRRSKAEATHA